MSGRRDDRRRADLRAFRPSIDGRLQLESRVLQANASAAINTAFGGQAVILRTPAGQSFYVLTSSGTVRASRMSGGRYGLVVDGTNLDTELTINPLVIRKTRDSAHTFNGAMSAQTGRINIGSINITNGTIGSVLGYRTAVLSGPLIVRGGNRVDRVAFNTLLPGASIRVGGDLNTLDVLNNATLSGGNTGISVGRDLNFLNVGGDLTITNSAEVFVNRDLGLIAQPAKGTGPAGHGAVIQGNFVLSNGGRLVVNRSLDAAFIVFGSTTGASNITFRSGGGSFRSLGGTTA